MSRVDTRDRTKRTKRVTLKGICFTLNNYTDKDVAAIKDNATYKYGVVGKEAGELGTKHLQGYVKLFKQKTAKTAYNELASIFETRPHMEIAKGSAKQNRAYCSKEGDFFEWGDIPTPGTRADLHAMRDAIIDGATWEQLALEHTNAHARYHKWGEKLRKCIRTRKAKEELKALMETKTLRTWQQACLDALATQSERTVLWIMDSTGGKGKTFLAKWLCVMNDAFYVEGGKKADISYAYDFQETVVFDLCRQTQDFVNYGTIESFKNGMLFSAKYESTMKVFKPAKVVVFSNWAPDRNALSADRWQIVNLDEPNWPIFRSARADPPADWHMSNEFIFTDDCFK